MSVLQEGTLFFKLKTKKSFFNLSFSPFIRIKGKDG